jgi:hypothetical protein
VRRVVAAFRPAAFFRLAAFPLAPLAIVSSSFLCPNQLQAYLDSRPISDVSSIAYRRRTIPCRGSGCDPRPPSRARLPEDEAVPTMHFSIAVIAAGGRSPQPFDAQGWSLSERYATSRESNGQQKPAEPAESRAKHSHSVAIR